MDALVIFDLDLSLIALNLVKPELDDGRWIEGSAVLAGVSGGRKKEEKKMEGDS